jgi:hypothetical protein
MECARKNSLTYRQRIIRAPGCLPLVILIFLVSNTCKKIGDETYNKDVIVSKLKTAIESFIKDSGYKNIMPDQRYLKLSTFS